MPKPSDTPPANKTLIFHIGDHKTGSTSIQTAFAKGQVKLQGHRIFYPPKLNNNGLREQCTSYGSAKTSEARRKLALPFERLAKRIRNSNAEFALISAESLERVPAALLREIIETYFTDAADEIRIVSYVRPHAGKVASSFAERTKIGAKLALNSTLDTFAEDQKKDRVIMYLPRFLAWREHFGDRFILRPMIRDQLYKGDVVQDFVHHAFGGIPFHVEDADTANESLCLEDLMRLKVLQSRLKVPRLLRLMTGWEIQRLIGHMPPPPQRTKLQLHRNLAEDIQATYLDDARAMDKAFFDGAPLMETELYAAVEKAIEAPQSTDPADHLSASELRSLNLMARLVAGLLEEKGVNWPAVLHKKRVADVIRARDDAARAAE